MNLFQLAEIMAVINPLMVFHNSKPHNSVQDALRQYCNERITQNPGVNPVAFNQALAAGLNPGAHPNQQQSFISPAQAAHLALPGNPNTNPQSLAASPATIPNMSPAMQHMNHLGAPTSVSMVAQGSHQGTVVSGGTGSQVGSATASPNVNKRRRPSGVKAEDEGGGEVNGLGPGGGKIRPSPRVGGGGNQAKKAKGN